jgi:RNA polymerase subunit RPABC4/transcription elongation factor Spt4
MGAPVIGRAQGYGECEVRRVTVAFDWRARAQLQQALDQIASSVDMGSPYGLWQGADMARRLLLQWLQSARAACFVSLKGSASAAEQLFNQVCEDVNRRYDQATISNQRRNEPPDVRARREEGEGFVVVSVVVGVNGALAPLPEWPTLDAVANALQTLVPATPDGLAALEVVWSPSIDQDRLSSAEMAVLYPELVALQGAEPIGRVACRNCKTVYARELGGCPTCGSQDAAPSPMSAQQQQQAFQASSTNMIACPFCKQPTPAYEVQCQHCGGRVKS